MDGRSHYYVLVRFRSPVTQWSDVIIHPVPDAHLDTCVSERVRTCGKITIKFPDCHYHGDLLAVCDTVCHPVTPPKCPDCSGFEYSRSHKDGGGRVLLAGSCLSTVFWFFGRKIHVQANSKLCFVAPEIISGTPKQLAARLKAREGLHSEVVAPESGKTGAKNKNKPLLYTDRLSRNGHRRKREWTLFVFSIYRKPYFFILWYSVEGFIFSNRAACSRCPLHIRRAFMMDFLSVFLSFYANTKRESHSFGVTSCMDYGK